MKVLKNRLFLVIVTAIICISVTAYATTTYQANQVVYKRNGVDVYLDSVLDDLYTSLDRPVNFGGAIYSPYNYAGDQLESKEITLSLNKGEYIVVASCVFANLSGTSSSVVYNNVTAQPISCVSSNCSISRVSNSYSNGTSTTINKSYTSLQSKVTLYHVIINNNSDTLKTSTTTFGDRTFNRLTLTLDAIPLNNG